MINFVNNILYHLILKLYDTIYWYDLQQLGGIQMGVDLYVASQLAVYINVYGFPGSDTSKHIAHLKNTPIYYQLNSQRFLKNNNS